jgi:putative DNA primase/helicase
LLEDGCAFDAAFILKAFCCERLKKKLRHELPGILNKALDGIACILQRGQFTKSASCEAAKKELKLDNDQVEQFIQDRCTLEPDAKVTSSEINHEYEEWARADRITYKLTQNALTKRLLQRGIQKSRGSNGTRMLAGIRIRDKIQSS